MSSFNEIVGINPDELVTRIIDRGVSKYDAAKLVNNLVAIHLGHAPRRFRYSAPVPQAEALACSPAFARLFAHQDWVDGESVVQAGESADDKGFNWRFNSLAADLDDLNLDAKRLYECLVVVVTAYAAALADVGAELNRLNSDVASLMQRLPAETPWRVDINDSPQFLGVRELDGRKVTMWKTDQNVMVLPGVETIALKDTIGQRLETSGLVMRYAATNKDFAKELAGGVAMKDLAVKFGAEPLGDGRTLEQALAVLPPEASFTTLEAAAEAVNIQEQAFIKSTVGSVEAVSTVTGVTSEGKPLTAISATAVAMSVANAPAELTTGLSKAGLNSVEDVAALGSKQLVGKLNAQGVTLSVGQALELSARASMLAKLRG
jgi:hypothetical protein